MKEKTQAELALKIVAELKKENDKADVLPSIQEAAGYNKDISLYLSKNGYVSCFADGSVLFLPELDGRKGENECYKMDNARYIANQDNWVIWKDGIWKVDEDTQEDEDDEDEDDDCSDES